MCGTGRAIFAMLFLSVHGLPESVITVYTFEELDLHVSFWHFMEHISVSN